MAQSATMTPGAAPTPVGTFPGSAALIAFTNSGGCTLAVVAGNMSAILQPGQAVVLPLLAGVTASANIAQGVTANNPSLTYNIGVLS